MSGPWSDDERAGHDFWLTRAGHGAGFWDRRYTGPDLDTLEGGASAPLWRIYATRDGARQAAIRAGYGHAYIIEL